MNIPEPTPSGVRDLYSYLLSQWSVSHARTTEMRSMLMGRNRIEVLEEDEERNMTPIEMHSGRPGGIIEHGRGLLMAMPAFSHETKDQTTEAKRESDQLEAIMAKVFQKSLMATDFWPSVGKEVLGYGYSFVKVLTLPSVWTFQTGYPVREKDEKPKAYLTRVKKFKAEDGKFPFLITHVPALNVLTLLDAEDNVICSIEAKRVMAGLLDELGSSTAQEAIRNGSVKWYEDLLVLEYMDVNWIAYYVGQTAISDKDQTLDILHVGFEEFRKTEHHIGKCPMVCVAGIKTGEVIYEDRFKSFLDDAKESLEAYDKLLSRLMTMVHAYYLPSYVYTMAQNSQQWAGKDKKALRVKLGGVTVMLADEGLMNLPYPTGLPDAEALLREVDDIIQRHTLEDVLFGRVVGSAPAFQVNLRINVARSKLTPIAQHMATSVIRVMDLFFRGVIALGKSVMVDDLEVTVGMAKAALGRIGVSIEPKSPVDRSQDIGTATMALQFGLPWDWICENILDISNPATLRLEKDIQELEATPEVQQRLLQDALAQLDVLIQQDEYADPNSIDLNSLPPGMAQAIQAGQQGGGGPGEPPPGPGGMSGLGNGPFPPGAAPQTIQGGRGLTTQKEQPMPGTPMVTTGG